MRGPRRTRGYAGKEGKKEWLVSGPRYVRPPGTRELNQPRQRQPRRCQPGRFVCKGKFGRFQQPRASEEKEERTKRGGLGERGGG